MDRDHFWLTEKQFAKIVPHLPTKTKGKALRNTLYNRFIPWTIKGVWVRLFHTLAQTRGPPAQALIDSSP